MELRGKTVLKPVTGGYVTKRREWDHRALLRRNAIPRSCESCQTALSRYNPESRCSVCARIKPAPKPETLKLTTAYCSECEYTRRIRDYEQLKPRSHVKAFLSCGHDVNVVVRRSA